MSKKHPPVAVIDVGAHSLRLDIFSVSRNGEISLFESLSRPLNLGYDVFRRGSVSPTSMELLSAGLRDFADKLREYRIASARAVATSAIREAFNRELVVDRVRNDTGIELEILDSQQEIKLIYLAMRETMSRRDDFPPRRGIVVIVGSGSLFVIYFEAGAMRFSEEIPLGTVRLYDALGRSEVSQIRLVETLESTDLPGRLQECGHFDATMPVSLFALGVAPRTLVGLESGSRSDGGGCVVLNPAEARKLFAECRQAPPAELCRRLSIPADRVDDAASGAAILAYFAEKFPCERWFFPALTTRGAVAAEMISRERRDEHPDFREDLLSVCDAIGTRYGYDPVHAENVARLALRIFTKLGRERRFAPGSKQLLEVAARLHDIGRFVDIRQHHKHSGYLLANMQLPGIGENEQRIIAAVARYHRKSEPSDSHQEYTTLPDQDKVTVLKLAAILRVADALDCSRHGAFAEAAITRHGHTLHLQSPFVGDLGVEKLYLEMKSGLFTSVFGLEITIGGAAI